MRAIVLVFAFVVFVIAAVVDIARTGISAVGLVAAGAALFTLPVMWDALEAA